jgi:predicted negative regulator of RcsB-dependent stress response
MIDKVLCQNNFIEGLLLYFIFGIGVVFGWLLFQNYGKSK